MNKVILITSRTGYWEDVKGGAPVLPLGLISISSLLVKDFIVEILDQRITPDIKKELAKKIDSTTILIGFTVFSGIMIRHSLELTEYIKENFSVPIVWGGPHPTIMPQQTINHPLIDFVIQGEGEEAIYELAQALSTETPSFVNINNLWYKQDGQSLHAKDKGFINLNALPDVPYTIVDLKNYASISIIDKTIRYIPYQASRGCLMSCNYCYNSTVNKKNFRIQSIEKTHKDINRLEPILENSGINAIFFVDDNLFLNKDYIMQLAKIMRNSQLMWFSQGADICSLKNYTIEDFKTLSESGLKYLTIGIETASPRLRKMLGKAGTVEDILQVTETMSSSPIIMYCNFMTNLPTETKEDLKMSVELILKLKKMKKELYLNPIFKFVPVYGTKMYEQVKDQVYLPKKLEEWKGITWESYNEQIFADFLKDERFFKGLILSSLLIDNKVQTSPYPWIVKFLHKIYSPINTFRFKHLFFKFHIELFVFERLFKIF